MNGELCLSWKLLTLGSLFRQYQMTINLRTIVLLSMEPWAAAKETLVSVAVPPAPVRVISQRPLALSVASVTRVANDKGDNEMILGAVHRSPGIYFTAKENLS